MEPEQYGLIRLAQAGDDAACAQLVEDNSGLIWSIARRFFGRGVDPEDLYQLGCVGLLKAIRGFDTGYGTRFSTYAVPKISGEIRRFLRDDGAVKVSRGMKERSRAVAAARSALEQTLGREPTLSELSARTGLSAEELATAEAAVSTAQSLQQPGGEAGYALEQTLGDDGQEERLVERFTLDAAMDALPERERMVIALRFFHGLTQDAAAKVLGISQVQVSRLERRALEAMREEMRTADT